MRRILVLVVIAALIAGMLVLASGGTATALRKAIPCKDGGIVVTPGPIVATIAQGGDFSFPEQGEECGEEGLTQACDQDFMRFICGDFTPG